MAAEQHRINLVLDDASIEAIDRLKDRLGTSNQTEVIRRALRLLDAITEDNKRVFVASRRAPNKLVEVYIYV